MEGTHFEPLATKNYLQVQLVDLGQVEDFDCSSRPPSELLFSQVESALLFPYFFELYLFRLELLESSFHSSGFAIGSLK